VPVCNRKVVEPWFNFRCGIASLCHCERQQCYVSHRGVEQSTRCGDPAWQRICNQNRSVLKLAWQSQIIMVRKSEEVLMKMIFLIMKYLAMSSNLF